jgi:hypothetical protein
LRYDRRVQEIEIPVGTSAASLLRSYLEASDEAEADAYLQRLIREEAWPVFERTLHRHRRDTEIEEVRSAAQASLLEQLAALRRGHREQPIRDFRAYAASLAHWAWREHLRRKNPQRVMLLNRLQYLLENRTGQKDFALWEANGESWCGWSTSRETERSSTPKLQWLTTDPAAAGREIFQGPGAPRDLRLLVRRLFDWLETPIALHDLANVIGDLWQISDRSASLQPVEGMETAEISPAEELVWKEYVRWLWLALDALSAAQCAAFLLHAHVLGDFEALGLASIRSLAPRLGFPAERLAALWPEIPLNDLRIAAELQCTRQQVINLRRIARDKLGRAWAEFSHRGNKRRGSASSSM